MDLRRQTTIDSTTTATGGNTTGGAPTTTTTTNATNANAAPAPKPGSGPAPPSSAAAAAQSLQLLLREDTLLTQHDLHVSKNAEEAAFAYAASLLKQEGGAVQQRATEALAEVDRKLALVQSLAERVSRTSPEAVAGPLLRLHGYDLGTVAEGQGDGQGGPVEGDENDDEYGGLDKEEKDDTNDGPASSTLVGTRDRCHRLQRQGEVLEGVAKRVESSLQRGLKRMESATSRLGRVLSLSATLKMILRLQFESTKLQGYDLDDLRDLTRAAASVAVMEDLFQQITKAEEPTVVKLMRPEAEATATAVRKAAASLLEQHQSGSGVVQLGATLQVYYHLGELPDAAWSAVEFGLQQASATSEEFWSVHAVSAIVDKATAQAKVASKTESTMQRNLQKKLREFRADASSVWANGVAKASLQVWNLHRVLNRKSDPVSRQVFVDVVSAAPIPAKFADCNTKGDFSVFSIYWEKFCVDLGHRLEDLLQNDKMSADVAALYPAVRSAVLRMLGSLYDTMQAGSSGVSLEDTSSSSWGVLGGSVALDDAFWTPETKVDGQQGQEESPLGVASADTWTRSDNAHDDNAEQRFLSGTGTTTSLSAIFQSNEWNSLQSVGLFPLQQAFLEACRDRLCAPIQFMFPEGMSVDEDGVPMNVLPSLPSRYDMQKLDYNIRAELALADPREGGGDLSMTTMIAEVVVDMVSRFCVRAETAVSESGEEGCLDNRGMPTDNLLHDLKVSNVMVSTKRGCKKIWRSRV